MSPKGSTKVSPRKHSEATDHTEDDDEYSNGGDSRGSLKMNMEEAANAILQKGNEERIILSRSGRSLYVFLLISRRGSDYF